MSGTTNQLNRQILQCAGSIQSSRAKRRQTQNRLIIRLKTPLLVVGGLLLAVSLVQHLSFGANTWRAVKSSWLQRVPVWLFALWQSTQHMQIQPTKRAAAGAGVNQPTVSN